MRIRHAATALVALGSASACAIGIGLVHTHEVRSDARDSALRSSSWSVQASTDFGSTWTAPVADQGGHLPVRVDTALLRDRPAYQPLTLRTTVGSRDDARVTMEAGTLLEGDPAAVAGVRVRAMPSRSGTCAAPTFNLDAATPAAAPPPHPVTDPTIVDPLHLSGGTRTTPGAPLTICLELSMDPDIDQITHATDSVLTLDWPIGVSRVDVQP